MKNIPNANPNPATSQSTPLHRFCVAPMMDWSDRHCRYLWRLISRHTFLYTEMVTTGAILHGDVERHLRFNAQEHPVALQLGGSDPRQLAQCAELAQQWGYDEVNLNCGCPSDRVQSGRFGAALMAEPELVAECFAAMQGAVDIPVTIKHRIGIDHQDEEKDLHHFVNSVATVGCKTFIVHARKAWLEGLSPRQNRDVPPLNYQRVYRLKSEFPELTFIINGGVTGLEQVQQHLEFVDGVMVGREAYNHPFLLARVDELFYDEPMSAADKPDQTDVLHRYADYCRGQLSQGVRLSSLTRHVLGLFQGQRGAKRFRRYISEHVRDENATEGILLDALKAIAETGR